MLNKKTCKNCKFKIGHIMHHRDGYERKLTVIKCHVWSPKLESFGHEGWIPIDLKCQHYKKESKEEDGNKQ
jgi:hypothetical protein